MRLVFEGSPQEIADLIDHLRKNVNLYNPPYITWTDTKPWWDYTTVTADSSSNKNSLTYATNSESLTIKASDLSNGTVCINSNNI